MVLSNLLRWMWSEVECPGTTSSAIRYAINVNVIFKKAFIGGSMDWMVLVWFGLLQASAG